MGKMSVGDLLKRAAKEPAAKKKSTTPSITLQGTDAVKALQAWIQADKDKKDAEARKAQAETDFFDEAEAARIAECQRDGSYHSSIKLNDEVLYSTANKYSAIKNADREKLEEVFGDKTDQYFVAKTEISLTDAALKDEKILEKLIAAVGESNFETYFEVGQYIKPTEALHEGRSLDPEIAVKADKLIKADILKQQKSSCKLS
jgi:hypothetical protein